jgi:hypothetical protein
MAHRSHVKVVEEVSKACASSALNIAVQELGADRQRPKRRAERRHLPKLARGERVSAHALTEAKSGFDVSAYRARPHASTATRTFSYSAKSRDARKKRTRDDGLPIVYRRIFRAPFGCQAMRLAFFHEGTKGSGRIRDRQCRMLTRANRRS